MASFSIFAEFQNSGCLELKATLDPNRAPHLYVTMHAYNIAAKFEQLQEIKKSDLKVAKEFHVGNFLQIIEDGSIFTNLTSCEPNSNVSGLKILEDATKALKNSGAISDDGEAVFFEPVRKDLEPHKGDTVSNYFTK
jgi:hypothetical protein